MPREMNMGAETSKSHRKQHRRWGGVGQEVQEMIISRERLDRIWPPEEQLLQTVSFCPLCVLLTPRGVGSKTAQGAHIGHSPGGITPTFSESLPMEESDSLPHSWRPHGNCADLL